MGFFSRAITRCFTIHMPGQSFDRHPPPFLPAEVLVKERLKGHVRYLSETIGIRNARNPEAYREAADYIEASLKELGLAVNVQEYPVIGQKVRNLEAVIEGTSKLPGVIIGAHYDSVDCPAANDNASGVAGVLEIARLIRERALPPRRTVRFVAFANEEPPYFCSEEMGSLVYARSLKANRVKLMGMLCMETIGYFSDLWGSQMIPKILKPTYTDDRGNFIGFFSNHKSRKWLKHVIGDFRTHAVVPSQGLAAPDIIQGIDFSDHWAFWECGYKAVMITDTAFMRYPHYHLPSDTWEKLTYDQFTRVVLGVEQTLWNLLTEY